MSDCDKCDNNMQRNCASCEFFLSQVVTDHGIRSKILTCPKFEASKRFDYSLHDQIGGVL